MRHIRHGKNREIALVECHSFRVAFHDRDPKWAEQAKDAAGLSSPRSVVITRDHHDGCIRQHLHETRELKKRVQNRGVCRSDGVKHVAGDQHQIRPQLDDDIDYAAQRSRDIRLALVDPGGCLPLVLSEAEVYVREVNQSHRVRIARIHCVIFVRTCIGAPCAAPFRAESPIVDLTMMLLFESVIQPSLRSI